MRGDDDVVLAYVYNSTLRVALLVLVTIVTYSNALSGYAVVKQLVFVQRDLSCAKFYLYRSQQFKH